MNSDRLTANGGRRGVLGSYRNHLNRGQARLAQLLGAPVETSSSGALVTTADGEEYLDCGGYGVFILGHCHPRVVEAVVRQVRTHPVGSRVMLQAPVAEAAEALSSVSPPGLEYVFFACSGTEAVEAALKLARLSGYRRVVAAENGYHGKTLGSLSVTGNAFFQKPFEPLVPGVSLVPFGDVTSLEAALAASAEPTAVLLEPVQGEAGVRLPGDGYLRHVRSMCDHYESILILDEIQTGLGRLGRWWGADWEGVAPDVLCTGKALGGGVLPVSAVVATPRLFEPLNRDPFLHTSTFSGTPVAAVAARVTLDVMRDEEIVDRADQLGGRLVPAVREAVGGEDSPVREVRGRGLLIGLQCDDGEAAGELMLELLHRRVLVSHSLNASAVVRLHPPAILEPVHEEWLVDALANACLAVAARRTSGPTVAPIEDHS